MRDSLDNKTLSLFPDEAHPAPYVPPPPWATFSKCWKWRYALGRRWEEGKSALFIMLNPSVADADKDDPTIRRCISFARGWGYGALEVVNLFAWRATDPKELRRWPKEVIEGQENEKHVKEAAARADLIVCAWGDQPRQYHPEQVERMMSWLPADRFLYCLKLTQKFAQPQHPLYLSAGTAPLLFREPPKKAEEAL